MFDLFVYAVLFYTLAAPALPWLYARGQDAAAARHGTGIALLLLVLLHVLLWPACAAANCGQGAIAIAALWGLAALSGMITLAVGVTLAQSRR